MAVNKQISLMNQARTSATFDSNKLKNIIHDNEETANSCRAAFHRLEATLELDDNMKLPIIYSGLDRDGLYFEGVRRARATMEDMLTHEHRHFEFLTERYQLANSSPFGLNLLMFRKTIELQGTPEQRDHWFSLIDTMKINGAYVQTELGHGTFVRGMETTATFDENTDEFVLHSPTLTATKYWPGGLGLSCSHAVVAAKLVTKGKDHGMHWFVVQIRSLEDYTPTPGVELGDIGMKMAYNGTCNGYARFEQLRIPRSGLLALHARVLPDGTYTKNETQGTNVAKKLYATMLDVRCVIIRCAGYGLAQALTIAARYSVVREQGQPMFSETQTREVPILAYKSQHYRLLTIISQAYAICFASKEMDRVHGEFARDRAQGVYERLSFTHALSTGLKAWATTVASAGSEEARKMCGGHGYMALSGLPDMVAAVTAMATLEGENTAIWQQLVRYLFRQVEEMLSGRPVDDGMQEFMRGLDVYLSGHSNFRVDIETILDSSTLLSIFRHHARRLLADAFRFFTQQKKESPTEAWNISMMYILSAGHAYAEYIVLQTFQNQVVTITASEPSLSPVLSQLCSLFALTTITHPTSFYAVPFAEDGILTAEMFAAMRSSINEILSALLPDIIALTDAWDFTDASLSSALGCRDGNVYERLMSWTRQLPVNTENTAKKAWEASNGIGSYLKSRL